MHHSVVSAVYFISFVYSQYFLLLNDRLLFADASLIFQDAWKHAIEKAKAMPDPWAEFHLEDIKTESCTRYR